MTDANSNTEAANTEKLDEALACVRKYGRQSAVDTRAIETALRDLRTRLSTRTHALEPADA